MSTTDPGSARRQAGFGRAIPTVLVAGFSGALGAGIGEILRTDPGLSVIGGEDSADVLSLVARDRPAVALINYEAMANLVDIRHLVLAYPDTRVVMAVMHLNRERETRLLEAGVRVVVPMTIDPRELRGVLRLVALGLVGPARPPRSESKDIGALTRREVQVMGLLVLRRSAREIAEELHVTEATVNTHRRHIYEKLGVHSRAELAEHAAGLLGSGRRKDDFVASPPGGHASFREPGEGGPAARRSHMRATIGS